MNSITTEQLYDLFVDTAKRCSSDIITLSDEQIECNLFEEFDIGARSFFHDDNLERLLKAGMITQEAVSISQSIRSQWIDLDKSSWTIDEIKVHPKWKSLFSDCDKLLSVLGERHSE